MCNYLSKEEDEYSLAIKQAIKETLKKGVSLQLFSIVWVFQGSCVSFVMTNDFSVRVTKITSRIGVSRHNSLPVLSVLHALSCHCVSLVLRIKKAATLAGHILVAVLFCRAANFKNLIIVFFWNIWLIYGS